jgi:hypothetical protein
MLATAVVLFERPTVVMGPARAMNHGGMRSPTAVIPMERDHRDAFYQQAVFDDVLSAVPAAGCEPITGARRLTPTHHTGVPTVRIQGAPICGRWQDELEHAEEPQHHNNDHNGDNQSHNAVRPTHSVCPPP